MRTSQAETFGQEFARTHGRQPTWSEILNGVGASGLSVEEEGALLRAACQSSAYEVALMKRETFKTRFDRDIV